MKIVIASNLKGVFEQFKLNTLQILLEWFQMSQFGVKSINISSSFVNLFLFS